MQSQLITVHDIRKAIEDVGPFPYQNSLVQEMGGDFYFVDTEAFRDDEDIKKWIERGYAVAEKSVFPDGFEYNIAYKLRVIPPKIADYIIQIWGAIADFGRITLNSYELHEIRPKRSVYLTPGTEILGQRIEKLTEIPAELRPVVVDKL